jgi:hypothetical protein
LQIVSSFGHLNIVAVVSSVVKQEFSCPCALDCLCNCCGLISWMGHYGAYIMLSMTNIMFSLFSGVILSCTVPLPRDARPPAMPFKVLFCMGVGCGMKSSMYGVTQHDAPKSIMVCDVSFVHAFVAISMAILRSSLFCKFDLLDLFCRSKSSCSSDAASC